MKTIRICSGCGGALPADAPTGLCPACMLKTVPTANPTATAKSGAPAATITLSPEAFEHVRYFGDYELQEEIARGGMGVVFKARQMSLNRTVALKMILAGKLAGEADVKRFRREAEAAANLQHPNIVAIYEVGEHNGQHYYSMDYVEGRDLGAVVRERGPFPPARAAECIKVIAQAVHFAHQHGTLHRDLKPQNVLMDTAGLPHITDFGLAKFTEREDTLTQAGAAMGSPSYMPPEQAAGRLDQVSPQSDVYALGAILYELLTGRPPFREETAIATMRQVMEAEPVAPRELNPVVPPDLQTICLKCLEKNPARRYDSARGLAEELGRFLNHQSIQAIPASASRKAESWLRLHPWSLMGMASFLILVLMGVLYWQYERANFAQQRRSLTEQAVGRSFLGPRDAWVGASLLVLLVVILAFRKYRRKITNANWQQALERPRSRRLRVTCGLISLGALGFTMIYMAKLIHDFVWVNGRTEIWGLSIIAGVLLLISIALLNLVVRDYQRFVYGGPGPLSASQTEALHEAIFEGRIEEAAKFYCRTVPDAALPEAQQYVRRLAAELKAAHPEKFAPPPKLRDLKWAKMAIWLVAGLGVFAGFWLMMPPVSPTKRVLAYAAGFLVGAGVGLWFSLRTHLASFWQRFLGRAGALLSTPLENSLKRFRESAGDKNLGWLFFFALMMLLCRLAIEWLGFLEFCYYAGGLWFGACMVQSGFPHKRLSAMLKLSK